jgi:hypothetical protein
MAPMSPNQNDIQVNVGYNDSALQSGTKSSQKAIASMKSSIDGAFNNLQNINIPSIKISDTSVPKLPPFDKAAYTREAKLAFANTVNTWNAEAANKRVKLAIDDTTPVKISGTISSLRTELNKATNNVRILGAEYRKTGKNGAEFAAAQERVAKATERLNKATGKTPFAGYALSLMFAGQMVKRSLMTMSTFGIKTFQEIAHSVEGTVTASDMLDGSMKYLGFTIGQALEPVVAFIVPIIDYISDWISNNEELFRTVTVLGIAIASALAIGGAIILAKNGFTDLFVHAKGLNWASIGTTITKGIGVIAIGYALKDMGNAFEEFEKGNFKKGFLTALSGALKAIGGMMLLTGAGTGVGAALIGIGFAIELVQTGTFFQTVNSVLGWIGALFGTWIDSIEYNFKQGLWKGIIGTLLDIITFLSKIPSGGFLLGALGITSVNKSLDDLNSKMKEMTGVANKFNFTTSMQQNAMRMKENAKELDLEVLKFVDPELYAEKTGGVLQQGGSTTTNYNTYISIDGYTSPNLVDSIVEQKFGEVIKNQTKYSGAPYRMG